MNDYSVDDKYLKSLNDYVKKVRTSKVVALTKALTDARKADIAVASPLPRKRRKKA